jgi:carbon monoxide dehydrogenase subunit G
MPKMVNEITVAASPEEAWRVVGDLAGVDSWIPGVVKAKVADGKRVCTLADGGEIHESITSYSDEARSYGYEQTRHPLKLEKSTGTFTVYQHGDGARVVWHAEVEVAGPSLEQMLRAGYAAALESLARRLEELGRS